MIISDSKIIKRKTPKTELGWRKGAGWGSGGFKLSYGLALLPPPKYFIILFFKWMDDLSLSEP